MQYWFSAFHVQKNFMKYCFSAEEMPFDRQ